MSSNIEWSKCPVSVTERDEMAETYKGVEIRLMVPNGGIIGASIRCGESAFQFPSENRFHDADWHIEECKKFINSLSWVTNHDHDELPC